MKPDDIEKLIEDYANQGVNRDTGFYKLFEGVMERVAFSNIKTKVLFEQFLFNMMSNYLKNYNISIVGFMELTVIYYCGYINSITYRGEVKKLETFIEIDDSKMIKKGWTSGNSIL